MHFPLLLALQGGVGSDVRRKRGGITKNNHLPPQAGYSSLAGGEIRSVRLIVVLIKFKLPLPLRFGEGTCKAGSG